MQNRTISNDVYNTAWNDLENRKIINSASFKYRGIIPEDELMSCQMIALWVSLETFRPDLGKKFTTYLYDGVIQSCRKWLSTYNRNKKIEAIYHISYLENIELDIDEYLECLDELDQTILKQRYIMKMTLHEIAKIHHCSHETIRRRIKKALGYIKRYFVE